MKPTAEQIEQIQTLLVKESASVSFRKKGTKEDAGYWYLTNNDVSESGPVDKDGNAKFFETHEMKDFLTFIADNEVVAEVNLDGTYSGDTPFESWDHLARYMGLTDLVVMSAKVPKKIAQRFEYYATRDTTVSEKLRSLIYNFVVESIKENAEEDAFR